ncbi:MAG: IS5/IS1182 family transposase, partial [Gammaproteobacteria bacterium]|nr:IS5/IS1182 family transposase [Gammaproteobacteria bacterium]
MVKEAKSNGIALKQTYVREAKDLRRKAVGYAHAKQFKRLRKTVKRQKTILGILLREIERKLENAPDAQTPEKLKVIMSRAERIRT